MNCSINLKLIKDKEIIIDEKNLNCTKEINDNNEKTLQFNMHSVDNIIKISKEKIIYIRENEEFRFELNSIEKNATYLLKEQDLLLDIKVEKINYEIEENKMTFIYQLESDESVNKVEITKGE